MNEHHATIRWKRTSADFTYDTYNRAHEMTFKKGAIVLAASSAPGVQGRRGPRRPGRSLRRGAVELPHADLPGDLRTQAHHSGRL